MAEVYGRLTGKPGVAIGQAAFLVHASLGAIEAHVSSSPMLLLTDLSDQGVFSHHGPYQAGTGEYGTWHARQTFPAITKETFVATTPVQAVQQTQLARKHALTGERGPVAVLYHSQSLGGRVGPDSMASLYATDVYLPDPQPPADTTLVEQAARLLLEAQRPVIIAGNVVRISQAFTELSTIAEALGIPVATTAAGKSTFAETHDLALGVFGNFGTPLANAVVADADAVLVIGSKLAPTDTAFETPKLLDPSRQTIIQIAAEVALIGDAKTTLTQLPEALTSANRVTAEDIAQRKASLQTARKKHGFFTASELFSNAAPVLPQRVIQELHKIIDPNAIVTCDAGETRLFMMHYFQTKAPNTFIQPAGVGGMGYAIPAALAAKPITPDRQVVATGDLPLA